jgi:DNA-binding response OmpR family regulator
MGRRKVIAERPTIVAADDEPGMRLLISSHLEREGFRVLVASHGAEALALVQREQPELVVLDVMMPDMDGFETLRQIRVFSMVPVILLTGRGGHGDRIQGLDLGADDYLTKPFSLNELSARIRAILRRSRQESPPAAPEPQLVMEIGALRIDTLRRLVTVHGEEVRLSPREWSLLQRLIAQPGRPVSHEELLPLVAGPHEEGRAQHLRVWISRLRQKLGDDPARPEIVRTVPGVGYEIIAVRPGDESEAADGER